MPGRPSGTPDGSSRASRSSWPTPGRRSAPVSGASGGSAPGTPPASRPAGASRPRGRWASSHRSDWQGRLDRRARPSAAPTASRPTAVPAEAVRRQVSSRSPGLGCTSPRSACTSSRSTANGSEPMSHLSPGRTEYTKRVPYHTFDVTALVRSKLATTPAGRSSATAGTAATCTATPARPTATGPNCSPNSKSSSPTAPSRRSPPTPSWQCRRGPDPLVRFAHGRGLRRPPGDPRLEQPRLRAGRRRGRRRSPSTSRPVQVVAHRGPADPRRRRNCGRSARRSCRPTSGGTSSTSARTWSATSACESAGPRPAR